ncbi:acetyl-CoA carboxylase biotin carboxyl carrier protein [Shouchella patagoniensis]|uniref:acetyl-CoA carboxylase biotin carboxyl carrier protein n=1 Tax=Shouchella patagoniensis TaxID=228576 RepID=UPI0009950EDE|nr:acetyl-CoA carboxylase biotin carboxyl carrier protein [Shouchella patagoniensis]
MLKIDEIKSLIEALDASSINELELEQENVKLSLKKQINAAPELTQSQQKPEPVAVQPTQTSISEEKAAFEQAPEKADDRNLFTVTSPMVGTFYSAPSPDSDPYVQEGDSVNEETVVCIVEAMKLMNPIVADTKGKIVEIVAQNGELVEYGQPLMVVECN